MRCALHKEGRSENGSARKEIGRRDGATTKPKGSKMVRRKKKSGKDAKRDRGQMGVRDIHGMRCKQQSHDERGVEMTGQEA